MQPSLNVALKSVILKLFGLNIKVRKSLEIRLVYRKQLRKLNRSVGKQLMKYYELWKPLLKAQQKATNSFSRQKYTLAYKLAVNYSAKFLKQKSLLSTRFKVYWFEKGKHRDYSSIKALFLAKHQSKQLENMLFTEARTMTCCFHIIVVVYRVSGWISSLLYWQKKRPFP